MSNMVVRTNVMAQNSHRNLGNVSNQQRTSSARLSSGFRINSAADDAAGLGISENMRAQIRGLDQASRNAQDGISVVQTAEGGLSTINEMVIRIRELTVQAANDTNTNEGAVNEDNMSNRARIQDEINNLVEEIERTAETLQFNGMTLLDGSQNEMWIQVGANAEQGIEIEMPNIIADVADVLEGLFDSDLDTHEGAIAVGSGSDISALLDGIDEVLAAVTAARGELGAIQNRLEFTIQNLDVSSENLSASNSRIRDTDMAAEMMRLTQANVLQQAATAMLAQANQAPQSVLQLLG